jgi:hypothetical protein
VQEYRRKQRTLVSAVRLELATAGFTYQKWGGAQRCKQGDWIVNNQSDVYTVDADSFARTFRMVAPGQYEKTGAVWAEMASESGIIHTKEGATAYSAGDYLVYNNPDREDGYAIGPDEFHKLYER